MKDLLVQMNVRRIQPCQRAFNKLDVAKAQLRGWTEREIEQEAWAKLMDQAKLSGIDWVWLMSDDIIVRQAHLDALRILARLHPVVTGYSQFTHSNWMVNLTDQPLVGSHPTPESYSFLRFDQVVAHDSPSLRTYFAGMSVTGMSVQHWEAFPFQCYYDQDDHPGYGSDFSLSKRLDAADIPIYAARDAFCYHWRHTHEHTNDPRDEQPLLGAKDLVWIV